jgi:ankyrin repeat protein
LDYPCFGGEIHNLAKTGDVKKIETLLAQNPALVNSKDAYGWTPLQIAALMGQKQAVRLLIEKGANLNEVDRFGFTALHLAAIRRNNDIYELLLENGAKKEVKAVSTPSEGSPGIFSAGDVRGRADRCTAGRQTTAN